MTNIFIFDQHTRNLSANHMTLLVKSAWMRSWIFQKWLQKLCHPVMSLKIVWFHPENELLLLFHSVTMAPKASFSTQMQVWNLNSRTFQSPKTAFTPHDSDSYTTKYQIQILSDQSNTKWKVQSREAFECWVWRGNKTKSQGSVDCYCFHVQPFNEVLYGTLN